MNLKLDLANAVKIVVKKDENHLLEYIIDNGEIKDVNIIETDPPKENPVTNDELKTALKIDDRYLLGKGEELASKIINARETVSKVKDAISDTSNTDALHEILQDGTSNIAETEKETTETKNATYGEKWPSQPNIKNLERSKKLMELVKNGSIDELIKKQNNKTNI